MSELVRELFPEVPERCQNCPGLENIAYDLSSSLRTAERATSSAVELMTTTDPESLTNRQGIEVELTEFWIMHAEQTQADARTFVKALTSRCEEGAVQFRTGQPLRKIVEKYRPRTIVEVGTVCGSTDAMACLIGTKIRKVPLYLAPKIQS